MHIEIRDQTLIERLNKLLPRPDAPYDEVIKTLLERPCKLKAAEIAQEVVERLLNVLPTQAGRAAIDEEKLRAVVERAIVKAIELKIVEELKNVAEEAKKAFVDASVKTTIDEEKLRAVVEEAVAKAVESKIEELRNAVEEISERTGVKAVKTAFRSGTFRHALYKNIGEAAIEIIEQIKDMMSQQITWSLIKQIIAEQINEIAAAQIKEVATTQIKEVAAAQIKEALTAHMPEILKAIEEARNGGGWETVMQWISKVPDKCLTFAEIKRLYGKDLNSEMLRRRGFVQRARGIWCYVDEARETPSPSS